jgi:hypothetical protein
MANVPSVKATGLMGMGIDMGANMQMTAVISAVMVSVRVLVMADASFSFCKEDTLFVFESQLIRIKMVYNQK